MVRRRHYGRQLLYSKGSWVLHVFEQKSPARAFAPHGGGPAQPQSVLLDAVMDNDGGGGSARDLETQLQELRCKTKAQEQCIVEYKKETEKLSTLAQGHASGEDMHGMMKVWLRDARQQSEDLR